MIGVFDSGLGGLTVVKEIFQQLPDYQVLYLGDTARTPYGNRSQELIYKFTEQAVDYLFKQGCQLIVVACNTASAEALRKIQQEWLPKNYPDRRVLGVIRPVAEQAAKETRSGRIGVVGTRGTVNSNAYSRELKALNKDLEVYQQSCPLLVPIVEEDLMNRPETAKILRNYLRPLKLKKIDILILGCTHYPMLLKQFRQIAGSRINILDSAGIVVEKLKDYLGRHPEIESKLIKGHVHKFLITDLTDNFSNQACKWLDKDIDVEKINLE